MRYLFGCITDQKALYAKAFKYVSHALLNHAYHVCFSELRNRCLRPGGYIEHLEFQMKIHSVPPADPEADMLYKKMEDSFLEMGRVMGKSFGLELHMRNQLAEAGE